MFGKKNASVTQAKIDSLIGAGTLIEGRVCFNGGLRIDGEVRGSVEAVTAASSSMLVISDQASVEGGVSVAHLILNGTIIGPVHATGSLEMQSRARIVGDVTYAAIEMHQGAVIDGRLVYLQEQGVEPNPSIE
ncbi:polymer-forming cytoskeletal protein [Azonexus sp.]|uniref:bactofilin family protein n=1 Tax=Azonexus sp. TaxID=1872668 RepID=UPI0027BA478C|nr:polymer-forming cytoskeletal protein [Azonexus sp.]